MFANWLKFKKYISVFFIISIYYFSFTSGILLLTHKDSKAQDYPSNDYNLPADWSKLKVVSELKQKAKDKILIVTNRPFNANDQNGVLFPNAIADFRKVTYLVAEFDSNEWHFKPVSDLNSGLNEINYNKDFLLFVHGHGKSFITSINRAYKIKKRYDASLIIFDWPSRNSNFNRSLSRVRRCGENYYNLILGLEKYKSQTFTPVQSLNMMCHSLGNYFVTHMVVNGNNQYLNRQIFDNLILNAPAIRSKEHGEVISQIKIAKQIYIASNYNDRVLRGAHLLTSGKMLGNEIIEPLATNAIYFDFTPAAGKEHTYFAGYHKFEYTNPKFFNIYNSILLGKTPDTASLKASELNNIYLVEPIK